MKIKGIPFWEQHIEKFILCGFGVVLVGVGVSQVLLRPNDVPIEGTEAGPDGIEQRLKVKADSIRQRLAEGATTQPLVEGEVPLAMKDFRAAVEGGVAPKSTLPVTAPALAAEILPSESVAGDARFFEPKLPAPVMLGVRQESDTLDETAVTQHPELTAVLKAQNGQDSASRDISWTIPYASIDLKAMREELHKGLPNAKPPLLPIPTLWYNDALWLVDVAFEREERLADGSWGNGAVIAQLPGQFSFRKEIPTADAILRDEMFRILSQKGKVLEVLQPEFLPTKGNTFSPTLLLDEKQVAATVGEDEQVRRLKRDYARRVADRDHTLELVKALGGPCEAQKPEDEKKKEKEKDKSKSNEGSGAGGGGGNAPPGGGGLSGGTGPGKNNRGEGKRTKEDEEKCVRLTRKWKDLVDQTEKLEAQLKVVAPDAAMAGSKTTSVDLAKDDIIRVWGHDITTNAGATYRYRCRIDTYNPFFTRKRQLVPDQQKLADAFVLPTATSEWGPAVTIEPPVSFFVTDAVAGEGRLGLGFAKVEVYRFHDGARRGETTVVQPGDRIGGPSESRRDAAGSVDFSTDWFVVDVVDDTSTSERGDRQRSAKVIVRRAADPTLVVRSPRQDATSDDRVRFSDELQAIRDAAQVAKEKPGSDNPKEGSGSPPKGPGAGGPGGGFGGGGGGNRPK